MDDLRNLLPAGRAAACELKKGTEVRISLRLVRWTFYRLWKGSPTIALTLLGISSARTQSFDHGAVRIETNTETRTGTGCVANPRQAARAGLGASAGDQAQTISDFIASSPLITYRRRDVRFDAALGEVWALVEECGHPERPLRALPLRLSRDQLLAMHLPAALGANLTSAQTSGSYPSPAGYAGAQLVALVEPPIVHAGDTVRLWQRGGAVQMELAAKAEQAGRSGDEIWLRSDAGGFTQRMRGVVRAPGSVEMLP